MMISIIILLLLLISLNSYSINIIEKQRQLDHHNAVPIPMLSVTIATDVNNYLIRLLNSIDYPINNIRILIGNDNETFVKSCLDVIEHVKANKSSYFYKAIIDINTINQNPGSANGFNHGLHGMMNSNITTWVLVINSDIAFYPGILRKISRETERSLANIETFGVGFTSLCCGGEWSAVIFTSRLVEKIGYMDENFYPAYYEDDDYAIRIHYSGYKAIKFSDTPLLHGEIDGSKDYASGIFKELYWKPKNDDATKRWKKMFEFGVKSSTKYIASKWGLTFIGKSNKLQLDCKTVIAINKMCKTPYMIPFNNTNYKLSYWNFDINLRNRIMAIGK